MQDQEVFLPSRQVRERYGVSDMWLHRRERDNSGFPKPYRVARRKLWKLSDLLEWERTLKAA